MSVHLILGYVVHRLGVILTSIIGRLRMNILSNRTLHLMHCAEIDFARQPCVGSIDQIDQSTHALKNILIEHTCNM